MQVLQTSSYQPKEPGFIKKHPYLVAGTIGALVAAITVATHHLWKDLLNTPHPCHNLFPKNYKDYEANLIHYSSKIGQIEVEDLNPDDIEEFNTIEKCAEFCYEKKGDPIICSALQAQSENFIEAVRIQTEVLKDVCLTPNSPECETLAKAHDFVDIMKQVNFAHPETTEAYYN